MAMRGKKLKKAICSLMAGLLLMGSVGMGVPAIDFDYWGVVIADTQLREYPDYGVIIEDVPMGSSVQICKEESSAGAYFVKVYKTRNIGYIDAHYISTNMWD